MLCAALPNSRTRLINKQGGGRVLLISPTEPEQLQLLGTLSWIPENFGADILFSEQGKLIGVQRKAFPADFIASLHDGRLAKEVAQMRQLDIAMLLLEGRPRWTIDGELVRDYTAGKSFNRSGFRNLCYSMWDVYGIIIDWADDSNDTVSAIMALKSWAGKAEHLTLTRRPKVQENPWGGTLTNRDYGLHLLQSLPGVGPKLAANMYDAFGRVPLRWDVEKKELAQVQGIGKVKLGQLWKLFEPHSLPNQQEHREEHCIVQ